METSVRKLFERYVSFFATCLVSLWGWLVGQATGAGACVLRLPEILALPRPVESRCTNLAGPRNAQNVPGPDFAVVAGGEENFCPWRDGEAPAGARVRGDRRGQAALSHQVPQMQASAPIDHG